MEEQAEMLHLTSLKVAVGIRATGSGVYLFGVEFLKECGWKCKTAF
jgi:hypothetical protein